MKSIGNLLGGGKGIVAALGIAGALAIGYQNASAQSTEEKDPISDATLLTAMARLGLNSSSETDRAAAEFLYTIGILNHDVEVAQARSDQITIIVDGRRQEISLPKNVIYNGKSFSPAPGYMWVDAESPSLETESIDERKLVRETFTYNNARDRDGDGLIKDGEYDKKDIFTVGEEMIVTIQYETPEDVQGKTLVSRVFGSDGKQVCDGGRNISEKHWFLIDLNMTGCNLPPGKYTAEWYLDGKLLLEHDFRVVENLGIHNR